MEEIIPKLERISWYEKPDEASLEIIKEIISVVKDVHALLIRFYVKVNNSTTEKLTRQEIKYLKSNLDDLREVYQDLEFVFFDSQNDEEMVGLAVQLSLLKVSSQNPA